MRGKMRLLLFLCVIVLAGAACSKKEANQTSQNPAAQTPGAQTTASGTSTSPQASAPPAQPTQPSLQPAQPAQPQTATATPPAAPVPTGTTLVVFLNRTISSKNAQTGETFAGTLARPVIVHGETLIPKGADVTGVVTEVKSAGKLAGAAQLSLKLTSVKVGGERYKVVSNTLAQTSKGKGKRTAVMGGGGAGAGAIVGGLAGGKKGALIGGLAGGGAGTAGSAFTGNADITLPAETALDFHLARPLDLSQPTTLSSSK